MPAASSRARTMRARPRRRAAMRSTIPGPRRATPLSRFAQRFVEELRRVHLPDLKSEGDLEQRVLIPMASRLAGDEPAVRIFVHPFKSHRRCDPDCNAAQSGHGRIVLGCPRCWRRASRCGRWRRSGPTIRLTWLLPMIISCLPWRPSSLGLGRGECRMRRSSDSSASVRSRRASTQASSAYSSIGGRSSPNGARTARLWMPGSRSWASDS